LGITSKQTKYLQFVYAELRAALGVRVAGGDILRLALLVCEALDEDDGDYAPNPRDSRSTMLLPVDEAMSDGGWKVLILEGKLGLKLYDDYDPGTISARERVKKFGEQVLWPRATRMD
jgi:hypothetical protein